VTGATHYDVRQLQLVLDEITIERPNKSRKLMVRYRKLTET
jgi:hypothetical protein